MKRVMSVMLIMSLLLIGCSSGESDKKEESKKEDPKQEENKKEETKKEEVKQEENEVGLNHDELLQNNRSSIAGDYVNPNGEVITVNEDGTLTFHNDMDWDASDQVASDVYYTEKGTYEWSLNPKNSPVGGGGVAIIPIGVEVNGYIIQEDGSSVLGTLSTNTDTIRMIHGQNAPTDEGVYTKK